MGVPTTGKEAKVRLQTGIANYLAGVVIASSLQRELDRVVLSDTPNTHLAIPTLILLQLTREEAIYTMTKMTESPSTALEDQSEIERELFRSVMRKANDAGISILIALDGLGKIFKKVEEGTLTFKAD